MKRSIGLGLLAFAFSCIAFSGTSFGQEAEEKVDVIVKQLKKQQVKGKASKIHVDVKKPNKGNQKEIRIVVEGDIDQAQLNKLIAQALEGSNKTVAGKKINVGVGAGKLKSGIQGKYRVVLGESVDKAKVGKAITRTLKGRNEVITLNGVKVDPSIKGNVKIHEVIREFKDQKGQEKKRFIIGVETEELSGQSRNVLGLNGKGGVLVTRVVADSPAQKAGLKKFDVIRKLGKHEIKTQFDLVKAVENIGDKKGNVFVLRNSKPITVQVKPTNQLVVRSGNKIGDFEVNVQKIVGKEIVGLHKNIDHKANVVVEVLADKAIANKDGLKTVRLKDLEVVLEGMKKDLKKDLNNEVVEIADVIYLEANKGNKSPSVKNVRSFGWTTDLTKKKNGYSIVSGVANPSKNLVKGGKVRWVPRNSTDAALKKIDANMEKMQKDMSRLADRIERLIQVLEK